MKYKYYVIIFWLLFLIGTLYFFYKLGEVYKEGWRRRRRRCDRRCRHRRWVAQQRRIQAERRRREEQRRREEAHRRHLERLRRIRAAQEAERRRREEERRRREAAERLARLRDERLQKYIELFMKTFGIKNTKYKTQNEMAGFFSSEEGLGNTVYYEDSKNNIKYTLDFNKDLFMSFFTTIRNTDYDYDIDLMKFKINIPNQFRQRCVGFNGIYYCAKQNIFPRNYVPSDEATITISSSKSPYKGKWKLHGTRRPFLGQIVKSIYLSYFPCNINNELYYFKQEST